VRRALLPDHVLDLLLKYTSSLVLIHVLSMTYAVMTHDDCSAGGQNAIDLTMRNGDRQWMRCNTLSADTLANGLNFSERNLLQFRLS
jgi:hypothetical protein